MSADVIRFYPKDAAKNPDAVLEQAVGDYQDLIIIGWAKDGVMDVRATTGINHTEILWLVEQFKLKLLSGDYSDDPDQ